MQTPGPARDLGSTPILDAIRRYPLPTARFSPLRFVLGLRPVVRICALIVNGANADLARFRRDLSRVRAIWGRCVAIEEGTVTTINADLDYPNWVGPGTAPSALLDMRGDCGPNDTRAYYVRSIGGNLFQGRSGITYGAPGYLALSDNAHENLFPHELGHLFLGGNEEHRDGTSLADRVNIMRSDVGTIEGFPQVDENQCTRAAARVRSGWAAGVAGVAPVRLQIEAFGTSPAATVRELLVAAGNNIAPVVGLGHVIVPHLVTILTSDPAPIIRARAAAALGRIGGAPAVQALVRSTRDTDPMVRVISTTALGLLGGVSAQTALIGSLRDPEPMVRIATLRALAAIRSPIAQASITEQARREPDPSVRALACGLATGMWS